MRLQENRRDLRIPDEKVERTSQTERHMWDLNRGLIGLSTILIAWLVLAILTIDGLSHLSGLPWSVI